MADENIPEHRTAITPRSGDTHVIGKDGEAVNVDEAARVLRQAQDERPAGSKKTKSKAKPKAPQVKKPPAKKVTAPVIDESSDKIDPVT